MIDPWVGKIPWKREWQPAPVFLPGEFHGEESGEPQSMGLRESDTTEQLTLSLSHIVTTPLLGARFCAGHGKGPPGIRA